MPPPKIQQVRGGAPIVWLTGAKPSTSAPVAPTVKGSKVVSPMLKASAPMLLSPACRPGEGVACVERLGGVDAAEQRVQVERLPIAASPGCR